MRSSEVQLHDSMLRMRQGDSAAARALLGDLAVRLRAFFRARGASPADAEDLVQETLIAIHAKAGLFDPTQRLLPWVHAIARHRLIDAWRRGGRRGIHLPLDDWSDLLADDRPEPGDPGRDVARLLAELPAKQRRSIELVKLQDLSLAEASERTGWSVADIKTSIHRGMKALMARVRTAERGVS